MLHPPQAEAEGEWKLTWECESGATYRLERSFDLQNWIPVNTLTANGSLLTNTDPGAAGQFQGFTLEDV